MRVSVKALRGEYWETVSNSKVGVGKEMGARTFRVGRGRDSDFIARAVGRQWSALSWVL